MRISESGLVAWCIFAVKEGHESEGAILTVAERGLSQGALLDEPEAFVEVAGASVIFEHVEEKAVRMEFFEGDPNELFENFPAEATPRGGDHNALEFDGAAILVEAAEDGVGFECACLVFADEVASVAADQVCLVAVLGPLADEGARRGQALDGDDAWDVG